ncbi:hypothetical protein CHCC14814_2202 [Bacillus paralicheniformis]|nr:hypothetical protein B4089_2020 [Bacillus licheniformis]OLF96984.1 hypothetical protein B4089_0585 [Bacillus licheniformis]TWM56221.1 hypothetical protein CHCC14814_2202 [Bacillus paralicheniformis]
MLFAILALSPILHNLAVFFFTIGKKNEKKLPVSAASARVSIYFCGFAPAIPFKTYPINKLYVLTAASRKNIVIRDSPSYNENVYHHYK